MPRSIHTLLILLIAVACSQASGQLWAQSYGNISTVAGNGLPGFSGDFGPAVQASLFGPTDVAVHPNGDLYIADTFNNRIRKVDKSGVITTVAGSGASVPGGFGDNGPATSAELNHPSGIAFDADGNLYIADTDHDRIRRVDGATGIITTVAGAGDRGYGGDGREATRASINSPSHIAFDARGSLFIADDGNHRVRRVAVATGIITTVAGTGNAGYNGDNQPATSADLQNPRAVLIDNAGNVYIADYGNHRVRVVDPAGVIRTFAGNGEFGFSGDGGLATAAQMKGPIALGRDRAGNIYVADSLDQRVRQVNIQTNVIRTVAGNGQSGYSGDGGPAVEAMIAGANVTFDAKDRMYIAQPDSNVIRAVEPLGVPTSITVAGGGIQSTTVNTAFGQPLVALVRDAAGTPVPGVPVVFVPSSSLSGASASFSPRNSVTTDANGLASVNATANAIVGTYTVYAGSTQFEALAGFELVNKAAVVPTYIEFLQQPNDTSAGAAISPPVTIRVTDASHNPIAGVQVSVGTTGLASGGGPQTTDSSGVATYANLKFEDVGAYRLSASAPNGLAITSNSFKINPGSATNVFAASGQGQSASVGTSYAAALKAFVSDTFGNGVAGVAVTFTAPSTGPSVTFSGSATATTNALGFATSPGMTANGETGLFAVTATAAGIPPPPVAFPLGNVAGTANKLAFVKQPTETAAGAPMTPAVTVQLKDASDNNVSTAGIVVTLQVSPVAGGTGRFATPPTQTTGPTGVATFTGLTFTQTGQFVLLAEASNVSSAASVPFTIRAGAPATIQAAGGTPQTTTIQTPFAQPLKAKVLDSSGNPVSGVTVTFTLPSTGASASLSPPSAVTNTSGEAAVSATANGVAGNYSVTAATAGVATSASFSLTNLAGTVGHVEFVQQPSNTPAGAVISPPVTVRVLDGGSNPIANTSVTIAVQGGTVALGGTLTTNTNASGVATFANLRITAAGSYQLTAVSGIMSAVSNSFQISSSVSSAIILVFEGDSQSAPTGAPYGGPLKAKVQDLFGNPLPGISVTFSAPASGASVTFSGPATAVSGADGVAISPAMTANSQTGAFQVTASSPSAQRPAVFNLTNLPGSANKLAFVQQPVDTAAGGTISPPVTVQLQDGSGNPAHTAGLAVALQASVVAQGARQLAASASQTTDANGLATFASLSISQAGTFTLQATSSGLASATSSSFKITTGVATSILAAAGTPQSALVQTPFGIPLQAAVTDANGNPIGGVVVVFTAPASGPGGLFSGQATVSVTTDAQGHASAVITANNTPGSYGVTASSTTVTGSAVFALTNLPPAASKLAIVQQPGNTAVGQVIAPPLTVQVVDSAGVPVNVLGIPVTVSLGSGTGTLSGTLVQLTGADGRATFGDLRIDQTGAKMLRSTSPEQLPVDSNIFQITAGSAGAITVYSGSPQATKVQQPFPAPLQVLVTDGAGNPLNGVSVTFTAPATGGPGGMFNGSPSVTTGQNGIATAPALVANNVAGSFVATATASGVGAPAQFSLFNLSGGQTIDIVLNPTELSFAHEINQPPPPGQIVQAFSSNSVPVNWIATSSASWLAATPTSGVTTGTFAVQVNPAGLPAGVYTGSISVTTQSSVAAVLVTYTITEKPKLMVTPGALVFRSTGGTVPPPAAQSLRLTSSSRPIAYTVSAQVSTPQAGTWLKVSPGTGQTIGTVTVNADPAGLKQGIYNGSVLIRPTESGLSSVTVPVTLVVGCGQGGCIPQPTITAVVNGASFQPTGAPGAIMTIFGTNFSDGAHQSSTYPLSTVLGSTSVSVDGIPAPLYYVSPTQINFQMPGAIRPPGGNVVVNNATLGSRASSSHAAAVNSVSPALFVTTDKRASALNGDSTVHTPATPIPAGGYVILYLTGQGAVAPTVTDGSAAPANPLSIINGAVAVTIGSKSAEVAFKGLAPGFAGLAQLNVIVPAGLAPGDQPVFVSIDGYASNVGLITVK